MTQILEALRPLAVPIASLHGDPANARKHNDRNLAAIKASLAKFGQRKPIVVQRQGMVVRAGNGTLAAAVALGWTDIAAVVVDDDDVAATAFAIADNRTAELAEWDDAVLADLLESIRGEPGIDMDSLGFSTGEVNRLFAATRPEDPSADEIPERPAVPKSKPGDLYILGNHRLLCGDSANPADVARLLDGAKPELLVTDPPYGVSFDAEWRDRAGLNACGPAEPSYMQRPAAHERQEGHKNTTISGDTIADWSHAFELVPSLRVAYVWHASSFSVDVGAGLRRIGFELRQQIIWRKPHFVLSRTHYHYQTEPCWYAVRKGSTAAWVGSRDQSNLWDAPSPKMLMNAGGAKEEKFDHPTQKPMLCMETPLANHELAEVYEPFGGSGTTLIACERQRKRCFAMEVDPKYVDVIVARWEKVTGGRSVLATQAPPGADDL